MASVDKDSSRKRTPWVVRWRDQEGKQRKRGFARKVDADRFRAETEHTMAVGSYIDPAAARITFRDFAEQWRSVQPHRPNTSGRVLSQLTTHAYPALGARPLAQLRASELQAFVTGLDLAPSSARSVFATVRAVLKAAISDRLISFDPADGVKLPELPVADVVPLTLEQVAALAEAVPAQYRGLIVADAGSGLRQGEAFGLEVRHVDFLRRTVKVEQQIQPTAGGGVVICPLKNRHSYRTVPLGRAVVGALAEHLADFPARDVEVLDTTGRRPVTRTARLIFTDDAGRALHRNRFNEYAWGPARTATGLPESTMHDLRHFFASLLIRGGLSVKVVADRLGHGDAAMTLRVYAHLWPDDADRSREAVDAVLLRDVPTVRPAIGG